MRIYFSHLALPSAESSNSQFPGCIFSKEAPNLNVSHFCQSLSKLPEDLMIPSLTHCSESFLSQKHPIVCVYVLCTEEIAQHGVYPKEKEE